VFEQLAREYRVIPVVCKTELYEGRTARIARTVRGTYLALAPAMEALEVSRLPWDALVRAFCAAVADRRSGRILASVPADFEHDALETGSLDDVEVIRRLRASDGTAHARYAIHRGGVTFIVKWPCGTLKLYEASLA
jgi:hypothetical protein